MIAYRSKNSTQSKHFKMRKKYLGRPCKYLRAIRISREYFLIR